MWQQQTGLCRWKRGLILSQNTKLENNLPEHLQAYPADSIAPYVYAQSSIQPVEKFVIRPLNCVLSLDCRTSARESSMIPKIKDYCFLGILQTVLCCRCSHWLIIIKIILSVLWVLSISFFPLLFIRLAHKGPVAALRNLFVSLPSFSLQTCVICCCYLCLGLLFPSCSDRLTLYLCLCVELSSFWKADNMEQAYARTKHTRKDKT